MRAQPAILLVLLGVLGAIALVQSAQEAPDLLSQASLARLLEQPVEARSKSTSSAPQPLWKALLEDPRVERTPAGVTLHLGRVLAFPTAAHGSAESAGELLALEAEGPEGKLGVPLWRAVLDGPALEQGEGRTLKLYGCRHSSDPDGGPVLEDTYTARLSLARSLRTLAAGESGALPLTILGEDFPVKGGVNFDVQLRGEVQTVRVTFDGHPGPLLGATRVHRPPAPNDARARANLILALRAHVASDPRLGHLTIAGELSPAADGIDVRLEHTEGHLRVVATGSGTRLAARLALRDSARAQ